MLADLAKHHLARTFPILSLQLGKNPTVESHNLYHLGDAAVGGLFCDLPSRSRVVNAMYLQRLPTITTPAGALSWLFLLAQLVQRSKNIY